MEEEVVRLVVEEIKDARYDWCLGASFLGKSLVEPERRVIRMKIVEKSTSLI
jgi:hypothetical protein